MASEIFLDGKNWEMAPQNTLVAILQVDCIDLEQSSS